MLLLNFSHPITHEQHQYLETLIGETLTSLPLPPVQFDNHSSYPDQVEELLSSIALMTPTTWQTSRMLLILPGHSPIAAILVAAIHGRSGYFPSFVRLRPRAGTTSPEFEVAEIINLQTIRDTARHTRHT